MDLRVYACMFIHMHVLYCFVLYFIVLYCIALHCIVLYCIIGNYGSLFLRLIGLVHSGCASDRPT